MTGKSVEPVVSISGLKVHFDAPEGEPLQVIDSLDFQVKPSEFVSILGPSGCGKTTLLRVIAGLLKPSAGRVTFGKEHDSHKAIGLAFQQANLMPWRSVYANIALPLEIAGYSQAEIDTRVSGLIHLVSLEGFEKAYPRDLSGGMQQRVSIARALIQDPDLLLLDEPFGSLDALTRERMGDELLAIWQASRKTVIMVTHSISEAVYLSDRVIVLTPRPAQINMDLEITLPRPRNAGTRYHPHFGKLAWKVRQAIEIDRI
jgi:NitT/TauT family transport system ATP-binding protein